MTHEAAVERSRARRFGTAARLIVILAAAVLIPGSGIWLTVSAWHTRSLLQPVRGGITTTGTVVSFEVHHFRGYTYAPIVQFNDESGMPHLVKGPPSSDPVHLGAPALVSYDPRNPANAHDLSASSDSWQTPFYTGLFALAMAVIFIGFMLFLLLLRRRRERADERIAPP